MAVKVTMPNGGDENIPENAVFVIREATAYEKQENPEFLTCIWGQGFRVYPAETLPGLIEKFEDLIRLVRATAPSGQEVIVSVDRVVDRDDPLSSDDTNARSVLKFGVGFRPPRIAVKETRAELVVIWTKAGADPSVLA